MAAPSGAIPCEIPGSAPSHGLSLPLLVQRFQRPLKIPQARIPAGAVEGKVQAVEGQQRLGAVGGDGRREQLLAGGTLPSSWHLLLFLANQVSLALCCPTGWEASLVAGDLRDLLLSQGTSQRSHR